MNNKNKAIIVVGYPKSGNTWTARLVAECLDSPVRRFKNALPLATEGDGRSGDYFITQLHTKPVVDKKSDVAIQNPWSMNMSGLAGERVIFVIRDPRDVVVSIKHYWEIPTIRQTILKMTKGEHPLGGVGSYNIFIDKWSRYFGAIYPNNGYIVRVVRYEDLHENAYQTLVNVFEKFNISFSKEKVMQAIFNQSFAEKKKQIEIDGNTRPYGKGIQLKNLRKGEIGDWRNHFTQQDINFFNHHLGNVMEILGYD